MRYIHLPLKGEVREALQHYKSDVEQNGAWHQQVLSDQVRSELCFIKLGCQDDHDRPSDDQTKSWHIILDDECLFEHEQG